MKFIHRAQVHGRIKTALFAGLVFWAGLTLTMSAYFSATEGALEPRDFFVVSAVCLIGAILGGAAMLLRHPMIPPPGTKFDDGGESLGVQARLIPPSPVLGGRAVPAADEKEA